MKRYLLVFAAALTMSAPAFAGTKTNGGGEGQGTSTGITPMLCMPKGTSMICKSVMLDQGLVIERTQDGFIVKAAEELAVNRGIEGS